MSSDDRTWTDRERSEERARRVWGAEGLEVFRSLAQRRTQGWIRGQLDRLVEQLDRASPAIEELVPELGLKPMRGPGGHVVLAVPDNSLPTLAVLALFQGKVKEAKESLEKALTMAKEVRDLARSAALARDADGNEWFVVSGASAPVQRNAFVRAVRRDWRNAGLEGGPPSSPCEWGYAAIATHLSDPCESLEEWKDLEKQFSNSLDQVTSKPA